LGTPLTDTTRAQKYSGIVGGPVDQTSKGFLWDPTLNYISVNHTYQDGTWSAHQPWQRAPTPACEPFPTAEQTVNILNFQGRWGASRAFLSLFFSDVTVFLLSLSGNSFHELRHRAAASSDIGSNPFHMIGSKVQDLIEKVKDDDDDKGKPDNDDITPDQKFLKLVWGEGPTGECTAVKSVG
jgi:hypothetical protein